MADEEDKADSSKSRKVQLHVPQELDYLYRDIVNVYVGAGDVVLEFGNLHRSMPGHASISNRIVLSVANAYDLYNNLGSALADAQKKLQKSLDK